ncbi:ABC transporter permease subunit [Senegalia massiliensis]|uniref:ABC transporter permease subunit n=1 Tax=Senegalia massiliensis TaxID=1720316 RepID=UPI00103000EA|nr:ABC transporter permease subunit [Senegalia massiliensis]
MLNKLKKLNIPLIIGIIIVSLIVFILIFGYRIIPLDPFATNFGLPKLEGDTLNVSNPPNPPNNINIWGTDSIGRDIFSRVIYGAKLTIGLAFITSIFRFLIAIPFSFLAAFGSKRSSDIIDFFNMSFSALPAIVISYIILNYYYIYNMEIESAFIAYIVVLSVIGWGRVGAILREKIEDIKSQDFIKGEIAIGKSSLLIAVENIFPHLFANIIIYFFIEISRVLIIIAELGVLGIYIGVNKINPELLERIDSTITPSYYPEWGSMLASARYAISAWKPWIVMYPALALFVTVFGFNLLGEGLKEEVNKKNSKFIIFIKHIPYHLSPITFIHQIKNKEKYKKSILIKLSLVLILGLVFLYPPSISKYKVDSNRIYNEVEEISNQKYNNRVIGTEGHEEFSTYIVKQLEENNIIPLFEDGYINKGNINVEMNNIKKAEMHLKKGEEKINFKYKDDFIMENIYLNETSDSIYEGKISGKLLLYEDYLNEKYNEEENYFLIVDNWNSYNKIATEINKEKFITGVLLSSVTSLEDIVSFVNIAGSIDDLKKDKEQFGSAFRGYITEDTVQELKKYSKEELIIEYKLKNLKNVEVKNIGGYIEGEGLDEPPLIIATNYDYFSNDIDDLGNGVFYNGTSIAANLEIMKVLSQNNFTLKRDIIFLFFDGSKGTREKGTDLFRNTDFYNKLSPYHFIMQLNFLGYKNSDSLSIDTSLLYSDNKNHYNFIKGIFKRAKELGIEFKIDKVSNTNDGITDMHVNGSSGVLISSINDNERKEVENIEQNINIINEKKLKNQIQLIIDAITLYEYEFD